MTVRRCSALCPATVSPHRQCVGGRAARTARAARTPTAVRESSMNSLPAPLSQTLWVYAEAHCSSILAPLSGVNTHKLTRRHIPQDVANTRPSSVARRHEPPPHLQPHMCIPKSRRHAAATATATASGVSANSEGAPRTTTPRRADAASAFDGERLVASGSPGTRPLALPVVFSRGWSRRDIASTAGGSSATGIAFQFQ